MGPSDMKVSGSTAGQGLQYFDLGRISLRKATRTVCISIQRGQDCSGVGLARNAISGHLKRPRGGRVTSL